VLVLQTQGIHEVSRSDGLRWHDVRTNYYDDRFRHSSNIKIITSTI
jgi:hypothetical protein